jgi:hypothetical protein
MQAILDGAAGRKALRLAGPWLGLALLVAACQPAKPVGPDAVTGLDGASRAAIAQCAGPPAATSTLGEVEYLIYRGEVTAGQSDLSTLPTVPIVGSLAIGDPGHKIACEASIVLRKGAVVAVAYRTEPYLGNKEAARFCRPVLASCLDGSPDAAK